MDGVMFYWKRKGVYGGMCGENVKKMVKKYGLIGDESCEDVGLKLDGDELRDGKGWDWVENGMKIGEIWYLVGDEWMERRMGYVDISREEEEKGLERVEKESEKNMGKKWKKNKIWEVKYCEDKFEELKVKVCVNIEKLIDREGVCKNRNIEL